MYNSEEQGDPVGLFGKSDKYHNAEEAAHLNVSHSQSHISQAREAGASGPCFSGNGGIEAAAVSEYGQARSSINGVAAPAPLSGEAATEGKGPDSASDLNDVLLAALEQISRACSALQTLADAIYSDVTALSAQPDQSVVKSTADRERLRMLTAREVEVLRLVSLGRSSKHIAHDLGISLKTVVAHRSNIMNKLNIRDSPILIRFAIRVGLTEP